MKHTFECKSCHKMELCDNKEQLQVLKDKHWTKNKAGQRIHTPVFSTCHVETRTSKNSGKPYVVIVAD